MNKRDPPLWRFAALIAFFLLVIGFAVYNHRENREHGIMHMDSAMFTPVRQDPCSEEDYCILTVRGGTLRINVFTFMPEEYDLVDRAITDQMEVCAHNLNSTSVAHTWAIDSVSTTCP